eukprot:CAMPEP_0115829510 /NCGR_PEP_ID=MMETSP0287-20121206/1138_1 /TAXON_ID=412157 /ORGANISM="Chrysochromulina rotalis, Strain UIO044" /LENGTH=62 /DNA_ID=CAMNT_0003282783 /DNA_START=1062 /DNA_END=1250 /DNA_ORIENTATION=-
MVAAKWAKLLYKGDMAHAAASLVPRHAAVAGDDANKILSVSVRRRDLRFPDLAQRMFMHDGT